MNWFFFFVVFFCFFAFFLLFVKKLDFLFVSFFPASSPGTGPQKDIPLTPCTFAVYFIFNEL